MCVCVLPAFVCVPSSCLELVEARKGICSAETGVTDGCEALYGCWELNLVLLEE